MQRILIIAAHPDDEAIANGGLIIRARDRGWPVRCLIGSIGECRQLLTGATDPALRSSELRAAAEFGRYSFDVMWGEAEFMRLDTLPRKVICDRIEDEIESWRPSIVVIPPASSYDQDHRALAAGAVTALRPRPLLLRHQVELVLESDEPYWWRQGGERPAPNFFLHLSAQDVEAKCRLMAMHASQVRPDPFGRSLENLSRNARSLGTEIGHEAAEAYRVLRASASLMGL
jgi:LmbE family N-acetylglucosaminyl deacetylase